VRRWLLDDKPDLWVLFRKDMALLCPFRHRTVMLDKYDTDLVDLIDRHIDRIQQCATDEEVQSSYNSCKRMVQAVVSRTVPAASKTPSFHGTRMELSRQHREVIARMVRPLE
jgi:hypothetical protein